MNEMAASANKLGVARAAIGLLQGLALYLIYVAYEDKSWPATDGLVFAPLLLVFLFVPLLVLQALGNMRPATLGVWAGAAALLLAGLGFYDIWHAWPEDFTAGQTPVAGPHILPSPQLFAALTGGFFIAQSLIAGGDAERKIIPSYATHFDVAWKLAVQAVAAAAFTAVFWGLLWLGAGLFDLIKIDFVRRLIEHRWFAIPATTLAFAVAIHVTDVRAAIVRGIRTLGLTLLSWLLPLMTLIAAGFLATLVFTGLQPLWDTRFATSLLLAAAGALVVLVNAAYQDGDAERTAPRVLRYPGWLAAVALVPLVLLALYALLLRVEQYGWTADRVYAAAGVLVAACYAAGYAAAVPARGPWLKRIERWNFYSALVVLGALLALFSPIADPYRISVASQMAQLESGKIAPEQFDFANLRWEGGRFGQQALAQLQHTDLTKNAAFVRQSATAAMQAINRNLAIAKPLDAANVTLHPADAKLPESFLHQDWRNVPQPFAIAGCLRIVAVKCDAWLMDLDGDGASEVLLLQGAQLTAYSGPPDGPWVFAGSWALPAACANVMQAMRAGTFKTVAPAPSHWPDIEIMGQRFFHLNPSTPAPCPAN